VRRRVSLRTYRLSAIADCRCAHRAARHDAAIIAAGFVSRYPLKERGRVPHHPGGRTIVSDSIEFEVPPLGGCCRDKPLLARSDRRATGRYALQTHTSRKAFDVSAADDLADASSSTIIFLSGPRRAESGDVTGPRSSCSAPRSTDGTVDARPETRGRSLAEDRRARGRHRRSESRHQTAKDCFAGNGPRPLSTASTRCARSARVSG